jgi:hypothetical protein
VIYCLDCSLANSLKIANTRPLGVFRWSFLGNLSTSIPLSLIVIIDTEHPIFLFVKLYTSSIRSLIPESDR